MKRKPMTQNSNVQGLICAGAFVCAATAIGWLFRILQFPETNIVVVYILSVILTARFTDGYIWGILATVLSTCAFNIFFTHPYYTLSVDDTTYFISGERAGKAIRHPCACLWQHCVKSWNRKKIHLNIFRHILVWDIAWFRLMTSRHILQSDHTKGRKSAVLCIILRDTAFLYETLVSSNFVHKSAVGVNYLSVC